jgi:translation initiation factor 2 alpha subunit (eIF-2alpha)
MSYYYQKKIPNVGDRVVIKPLNISDLVIDCILLEYNDLPASLPISKLKNKRFKSVKSQLNINIDVACVDEIAKGNYIMLSQIGANILIQKAKKRHDTKVINVNDMDWNINYKVRKNIDTIINKITHFDNSITKESLYNIVWNIYDDDQELVDNNEFINFISEYENMKHLFTIEKFEEFKNIILVLYSIKNPTSFNITLTAPDNNINTIINHLLKIKTQYDIDIFHDNAPIYRIVYKSPELYTKKDEIEKLCLSI